MKKYIPKTLVPFAQKMRHSLFLILYKILHILPMKKGSVALLSNSRDDLTGNLQFIADELNNQNIPYISYTKKKFGILGSLKLTYILALYENILIDDFFPLIYSIEPRKGSKLIQVWHACGAFKTFGFSRVGKPGGPSENSRTHRNYTHAIVSAQDIRKNYAEGFGIDFDKVLAFGVPRTDMFFDEKWKEDRKNQILDKYPQLKGKKVITFAPTFRGNGRKSAHYDFSWINWEEIYKKYNKEYVFVIKLHPFINNADEILLPEGSEDFYIDLTEEREINDILLTTDILITDYSSVIFEYSLLNKPIIFFVPDLEEYIAERDFYYLFKEYVFGEVVKKPSDLAKSIKNAKVDSDMLDTFYQKFMGSCDGKASERIVNELLKKND